ncbi:MAG: hypothetical protein FJ271_33740, partial [Planctomycetes bacterium]|nr:hypothetical protein [Planctomycetota bacterium]
MRRLLRVTARRGDGATFIAIGRCGWALQTLIDAGACGCTPLDCPGPRWSGYVHRLRRDHGLLIETLDERHGGPFAGSHARYVLREPVAIVAVAGDQ